MRKKLLSIMLCVILSSPAYGAALNGTMQWGVMTTGADTNAGGFDPGVTSPGTNEAQAAASGTAISVTLATGTTGTCSPGCTSTTHGPGNTVIIASGSGCSTGTYEILSQSGGTITVNATMGSATDVCVGVIGGSKLTLGAANTLAVTNNTINIQTGTYTLSAALQLAVPMGLIGYQTTWADRGTKPLITTSTNSIKLIQNTGGTVGQQFIFANLSLSTTAGTPGVGIDADASGGPGAMVDSVIFNGFSKGIQSNVNVDWAFGRLLVRNSTFENSTTNAIDDLNTVASSSLILLNNYFSANASAVVTPQASPASVTAIGNVFTGNSTVAMQVQSNSAVLIGNVFNGTTGSGSAQNGTGLELNVGIGTVWLQNNIAYGNAAWGIGNNAPANILNIFTVGNAYGSNTSGNLGAGIPASASDVTLTANPWVSPAGGNFALNSTAGGGAALKGVGFPGVSLFGTGYIDIGPLQSQAAAGGGLLVNPGTSGGFRN